MTDKLRKTLAEFRKNHSTQHCFIFKLVKQKKISDQGGYICTVFMDPPKGFETLKNHLLVAQVTSKELGAYGFETDASRYMNSYLINTKQSLSVKKKISEWERVITGVSQGPILRFLQFHIFTLFFFNFKVVLEQPCW